MHFFPSSPNRPTGPIRFSSCNVRPVSWVVVPFQCNSSRGAKEVPGKQSCLTPWHQYPEKMYIKKLHHCNWQSPTRLQVLLVMADNLSIGRRCIKDSEGEKSAKKGKKVSKNAQKVLQSAHIQRYSVSCMSVPILPSSRLMSARNAVKF